MSLRDNAIVAYAETKVMKKRDRDAWVLMGEILLRISSCPMIRTSPPNCASGSMSIRPTSFCRSIRRAKSNRT